MKSEAKIQQEIVVWFRNNYQRKGVDKGVIFSVPNEAWAKMGLKNKIIFRIYKDLLLTGLLSGVSDLIVVMKNRVIFVEVKNEIGKQSPKQKTFEEQVKKLGFEYFLVRNKENFIDILNK